MQNKGMHSNKVPKKQRLERCNAFKYVESNAGLTSLFGSFGTLLTEFCGRPSFRIGGAEAEINHMCRALGLSGPEDFCIPAAAAWEASKTRLSSDFGQWEKKERIGTGRFGIVHVGLNRITGELCAIKDMLDIDDLQTAQSLHQEIQILSRLEHQNIVKYYGSERVESQISIYMEYVQPGSLKKYIRSRGALQESLVRYFTVQILSGLVYLHSQRVVHRDIKGDNLLVDSENNVKLADFGLAKHLAESAGKHSVLGTPYYAAPEVIQKEEYDNSGEASAADIWSLGCVIIEMFTGMHPWHGFNPVQAMFNVCCLKRNPTIPENLSLAGQGFLKSCFTRNPARRPSAAALLNHPFVKTQF